MTPQLGKEGEMCSKKAQGRKGANQGTILRMIQRVASRGLTIDTNHVVQVEPKLPLRK